MAKAKTKKKDTVVTTNICGVKNFLPTIEKGEDERTIDIHIQKMKEQFALHPYKRKLTIVEIGMKKTFSKRREMITSGLRSVGDIIDDFPFLADGGQVKLFIFRLGFGV